MINDLVEVEYLQGKGQQIQIRMYKRSVFWASCIASILNIAKIWDLPKTLISSLTPPHTSIRSCTQRKKGTKTLPFWHHIGKLWLFRQYFGAPWAPLMCGKTTPKQCPNGFCFMADKWCPKVTVLVPLVCFFSSLGPPSSGLLKYRLLPFNQ